MLDPQAFATPCSDFLFPILSHFNCTVNYIGPQMRYFVGRPTLGQHDRHNKIMRMRPTQRASKALDCLAVGACIQAREVAWGFAQACRPTKLTVSACAGKKA